MQKFIVTEKEPIRLNAHLSSIGVASRRSTDTLIEKKKVAVNGKVATLGEKVKKGDIITIQTEVQTYSYILYYKPKGEVTDLLPKYPSLHPLGRLDKESEGLLLYTNDYRLNEALLHPTKGNEREYSVTVREQMTPRVKRLLELGITTQETTYKKAARVVIHDNKHTLSIILTEGKKHEIRRMLNALNLTIMSLKRTRILFLTIGKLKPGESRPLTDQETSHLLTLTLQEA